MYAAIFIDAIVVKVRDGRARQPAPSAPRSGSPLDAERFLRPRAGPNGGGAKFWMAALAGIQNHAITDVFPVVCDG